MLSKRWGLILAGLTTVALMGCGKPPTAKIEQTETAMRAAQTAEAREYAADAYVAAEQALARAQAAKTEQDSKFALFRSYGDVEAMYDSANALAAQAEAEAIQEKERLRAEVAAEITTVESMITAAGAALDAAPRGKGSKADIELMKANLEAIGSAFAAAKVDFEAGRYNPAKSKLAAIQANVNSLTAEIEAAVAKTKR